MTARQDLIFSVFTRLTLDLGGPVNSEWLNHVKGLAGHGQIDWDKIIGELTMSDTEKTLEAMRKGKTLLSEVIGDFEMFKFPQIALDAIDTVLLKLTKGIFYKITSRIFPNCGVIRMGLITNYNSADPEWQAFLEPLATFPAFPISIKRNNRDLSDQMKAAASKNDDDRWMFIKLSFYDSITALVIAMVDNTEEQQLFRDGSSFDQFFRKIQ